MSNSEKNSSLMYGLKLKTITSIQEIFYSHPHIERALLYGSRAMGTYKLASDIDLVLEGDQLNFEELLKVENELDDLLLPYKIDLSLYSQIENQGLVEHIKRVGVVFYQK